MRTMEWSTRALLVVPVVLAAAGVSGCKTLSERYIALEVWKYERCFGHPPPGFVPPGAVPPPMPQQAAMAPCGGNPCQQPCGPANPCTNCGGMSAGIPGGVPMAAGPTPVQASKPVIISDEVVLP
jgi:hypothetical protein